MAFAKTPLESIVITFHEGGVSDDPENMREFIFLIMDDRPVLQPGVHTDATGPVTLDELRAAVDRTGDALTEEQRQCVLQDAMRRAAAAGDPEALAPSKVEFLSTLRPETWNALDPSSKRIFAVQAIITKALFACAAAHAAE